MTVVTRGGPPRDLPDALLQPPVPYDPEREYASASYRAKQLVMLASDLVLERIAVPLEEPGEHVVDPLLTSGLLPPCYRRRYNRRFLEIFHNVIELTRNALVSDIPFLSNTASELAAHAILGEAQRVLEEPTEEAIDHAAAIDPRLPEQLMTNRDHLENEIELLLSATIEDADVLALFDVPADQDPEEHLTPPDGPAGWSLLRFENWLVPFGTAPRPHITYDGRAWAAEF